MDGQVMRERTTQFSTVGVPSRVLLNASYLYARVWRGRVFVILLFANGDGKWNAGG